MRYGVPYKGSKNSIAAALADALPPGPCFCDLFAGGCAMTHAALVHPEKWPRVIANDISPFGMRLFVDSIKGRYTVEKERRWIGRAAFEKLKAVEPYVALCWSFGNNGRSYLYGARIEAYKRAFHAALYTGRTAALDALGVDLRPALRHAGVSARYDAARPILSAFWKGRRNARPSMVSLQSLEALERLQSLEALERLQASETDYSRVEIPDGATVYCDIPYLGTDTYGKDKNVQTFSHRRFYSWANSRPFPVFVSEYTCPPGFRPVLTLKKRQLLNGQGAGDEVDEGLFVQERFAAKFRRGV